MNILDLIKKELDTTSYDGLYNQNGECACLGDAPCGELNGSCEFGYFQKCTPEEKVEFGFKIGKHENKKIEIIIQRYDVDFSFKCLVDGVLLDAKIPLEDSLKEQILLLSSEQIDELLKN